MRNKLKKLTRGMKFEERMQIMYALKAEQAKMPWRVSDEKNIFAICKGSRNPKKFRNNASNECAGYYAPSHIHTFRFPNSYAVSVCRTNKQT